MVTPTSWYAAPNGPSTAPNGYQRTAFDAAALLVMLQEANTLLTQRTAALNPQNDEIGELRIHVEQARRFVADAEFGRQIALLARRLSGYGRRVGIHLEFQW
jgi:hypothetical protein